MKIIYKLFFLIITLLSSCTSDFQKNVNVLNGEWRITAVRYVISKDLGIPIDSTAFGSFNKPLGSFYFNEDTQEGWYYFQNSANKDYFTWTTNPFGEITNLNFQLKDIKDVRSFLSTVSSRNVVPCGKKCITIEQYFTRFNNSNLNGFDGTKTAPLIFNGKDKDYTNVYFTLDKVSN